MTGKLHLFIGIRVRLGASLSIAFACLVFLFCSAELYAQGISVSPTGALLVGEPGSVVSQDISATNKFFVPQVVKCEVRDFWYEGDKIEYYPVGSVNKQQAGGWVRCLPNQVVLPGRAHATYKVIASIPSNAKGSYFAGILLTASRHFEDSETERPRSFMETRASFQLPVTVMVKGTVKPDIEVKNAHFVSGANFATFSADITNTGNTPVIGQVTLVVLDHSKNVLQNMNLVSNLILPGQSRQLTGHGAKKLPKGTYNAILTIAPARAPSVVKEISVEVR